MPTKRKLGDTMLETNVLKLLEKPMCGYAIMKAANKRLKLTLGPSAVYPMLLKLQEDGLLKSHWSLEGQRAQKIYELTPRGEAVLGANIVELKVWVAPLITVRADPL
jgi:DNA-binding PadR family transcriptional regulator